MPFQQLQPSHDLPSHLFIAGTYRSGILSGLIPHYGQMPKHIIVDSIVIMYPALRDQSLSYSVADPLLATRDLGNVPHTETLH